jgi:hypothetical protein
MIDRVAIYKYSFKGDTILKTENAELQITFLPNSFGIMPIAPRVGLTFEIISSPPLTGMRAFGGN